MVGTPTPLKNDGVKVSWDDDIPKTEWKVIKFHGSSHHQPAVDWFSRENLHRGPITFLGGSGVNKFRSSNSVKAPANRFPSGGCQLIIDPVLQRLVHDHIFNLRAMAAMR